MKSILLTALFFPLVCYAEITPIHSIQEVHRYLEENSLTLVAFDIDDTLIVLDDPAFQRPNFKVHHAEAFNALIGTLKPREKFLTFTLPLVKIPSHLIEPDAIHTINHLQKRGALTIGLTAAPAVRIGEFLVEDARIRELARMGIDFSLSFPHLSGTQFPHFTPSNMGNPPLYKEGILFTNDINKGAVLVNFLKTADMAPQVVVFVDDRMEHLHAVEHALAAHNSNIRYHGLHFQGDHGQYSSIDSENLIQKWSDMVDRSREILSQEEK